MNEMTINAAGPVSATPRLSYSMTYGGIVMTILAINLFTDPSRYADFDAYVFYLDTLVHFPPNSWLYFEVFSNIFLLAAQWVTQSVFSAIILAHYFLGAVFVLTLPAVFPPRRSPWPALLFMFAILGPPLAFVTIRATPAYFLVAIAVRQAMDRRFSAWPCLFAASLFHISSLLALVPMALLYFEHNLPSFLRSRRFYLLSAIVMVIFVAAMPQLSSSIAALIQSVPVISKYEVYATESENQTQIGHYLFLALASFLTIAFMYFDDKRGNILRLYVVASFGLYVVMFFAASPIAAFRQTPFWIIPLISTLPWGKLGVNKVTGPIFVLVCAGLFLSQFQQVYM